MTKGKKSVKKFRKYFSKMTFENTPIIVGIDNSADGFQALGYLFSHVPTPCNIVFLAIQYIESDLRKIKHTI
jgi:hypothetical protein